MADPVQLFPEQIGDPNEIMSTEQALLGSLVMNSSAGLRRVPPNFSSAHYLDPVHRDLHDVIVSLGECDGNIAVRAISAGSFDRAYVASLVSAGVSPLMVTNYCRTITDAFQRRKAVEIANAIIEEARSGFVDRPAAGIVTRAMVQLDGLVTAAGAVNPGRMLDAALDAAIVHAQRQDELAGYTTGMPSVDEAMGGLEPSTFTILAARPGMGKTALAMQWAIQIAKDAKAQQDGGVVGFSLEMSATQLARRALSEVSRISVTDLKRGRVEGRERILFAARQQLGGLPIMIEDAGGQNLAGMRQKCRAAVRRFGKLRLVFIDHMQIVKPDDDDRRQGNTQAIGRISNSLRDLSKEFECPVLCLSQLSRALLQREDKRPNLGDLRQSGDIEQDADTVAFLHREEVFMSGAEPQVSATLLPEKHAAATAAWHDKREKVRGKAELIFEKVRDGAGQKTVKLLFDGPTTSFSEDNGVTKLHFQPALSDYADRHLEEPPGLWP